MPYYYYAQKVFPTEMRVNPRKLPVETHVLSSVFLPPLTHTFHVNTTNCTGLIPYGAVCHSVKQGPPQEQQNNSIRRRHYAMLLSDVCLASVCLCRVHRA